jgi:ATP-binding cassette subfamily F protein uup
MGEPNVLFLDEPTNDLDIDTLTALEDLLDSWPGTLVVVSHDRYFIERVCDNVYALLGDGGVTHLPGGIDQYPRTAAAMIATIAKRPNTRIMIAPSW